MKFVNILTIHNEPNYGALLQAYGLYKVIENLGYNPRIIDLHMTFRARPKNFINSLLIKANNLRKGYNYCLDIANEFVKKHEAVRTCSFFSYKELYEFPWDKDDIYIIGSDQVWNPSITNLLKDCYTFKFLPEDCLKRCSYASSFGNIKDEEKLSKVLDIKNTLGRFKRILIREQFGKIYLEKYGIQSDVVVDPTILMGNYDNLTNDNVNPSQCEKILYLSLGEAPKMDAFTDSLASKLDSDIDKCFGYLQPQKDINKKWLKVEDWLGKIKNSKYVVTDSFHAMVFSIMLETPFFVYISEPSKIHRIINLLGLLGLEDRIVSSVDEAMSAKDIDFADVKLRIEKLRNESMNSLKQMLAEL